MNPLYYPDKCDCERIVSFLEGAAVAHRKHIACNLDQKAERIRAEGVAFMAKYKLSLPEPKFRIIEEAETEDGN